MRTVVKALVRSVVVCLAVWSSGPFQERGLAAATCPCSLFDNAVAEAGAATFVSDTAVDLGVKFSSSVDGYITGLRFFKPAASTGEHIGRLWTADGTLLGVAVFTNETASGWQEVTFNSPVAIAKDTTYVASYHTSSGYVVSANYFTARGIDNGPLHAPISSTTAGQGNGMYRYGPGGFPDSTFGGANYWVDVVFNTVATPDTTPPVVLIASPVNNAVNLPVHSSLTAAFSEPMNPASITSATFHLHKGTQTGHDALAEVPVIVTYDGVRIVATLDPSANLDYSQKYTAVVVGGSAGVKDIAGNAMAADFTWSFTTVDAPAPTPPPPGPGGPILVVSATASPIGIYYAEILRTEGLNAFATADISQLDAAMLAAYDTVILAEMPAGMLSAAHVSALTNWVGGGGQLIAMRPDSQLESLLGIARAGGTIKDAYFKIRTNAAPGQGLVSDTIQFHGTADRYTLRDAAEVATLFATEATTLGQPAVTIRTVGALGGHAIAFTFDLASSIVGLRQGNPAWSGQERDGQPPIRSDDLFFGAAPFDPQPDWVDLNKVGIPQADEQQRLLANIIHYVMLSGRPMPRFWYLPFGHKAAVMMTGDDHNRGGTVGRFNIYESASPLGCVSGDWTCIRSTSYIYTPSGLTRESAAAYAAKGFEVALHAQTNCLDWTPDSLRAFYTNQLAAFNSFFGGPGGLAPPRTHRMHCLAWSDYDTQPIVEAENGIRLDTSFYYWPPSWIRNRPGYFTGSALPMRYVRLDGSTIDVYQAVTHMTDESEQTFPMTVNALLDNALGPNAYYGVLTANMHTDTNDAGNAGFEGSAAIIASAKARGVPVVSAVQVLDWLDARNASSFQNIAWSGNRLAFTVSAPATARGLRAMIPAVTSAGRVVSMTRNGTAIGFSLDVIKGVEYAFADAASGTYEASYAVDTTPPALVATNPANAATGVDLLTNVTVQFSEAVAPQTVNATTVALVDAANVSVPATLTVSGAVVTLDPVATLLPNVTYTISISSSVADLSGNVMGAVRTSRFTTKGLIIADGAGGTATGTEVLHGEIVLRPDPNQAVPGTSADFPGATLPPGWSSKTWAAGGSAVPINGELVVNGAQAGFDSRTFPPGGRRAIEFEAKFTDDFFQHAGLALDYDMSSGPWIDFSTSRFGNRLFARVNDDLAELGAQWLNVWARFRIEWTATSAVFFINGTQVASWPESFPQPAGSFPVDALRPLASDLNIGASDLRIRWLRVGPYVGTGAFTSQVFDAGSQVRWGAVSWSSDLATGNGLVMIEERHGDSATPPASAAAGDGWSAFNVVPQSGASIDADARYAQYRATLITVDSNFTPALSDVTISFSAIPPKVEPTITWSDPAPITYGTPLSPTQLNASTGIPGTFGYSPAAGTILSAGTGQTLSVTFLPQDTAHYTAVSQSVTINVQKAPLTLTANSASRVYGVANPAFTASYSGFVNGDSAASLGGTLTFNTTATTTSAVGTYPITPGGLTSSNYAIAFANGALTITQATPTINWNAPANISAGTPLSAAQLNATASTGGTFVYAPPAGTVLTSGSHTLQTTFTPGDTTNYKTATASVTITVSGPAAPKITWPTPAAVPLNYALSYTQLNATADTTGTFAYNPPLGTVLSTPGIRRLNVTFTPTDTTRFATATAFVDINVVAPGAQTMTATLTSTTPSVQYSDTASFTVQITSSRAGQRPAGKVAFKIGTQSMAVADVTAVGDPATTTTYQAVWSGQLLEPSPSGTMPTGQLKPGLKMVSAQMLDPDPRFVMTNPSNKSMTIALEDARVAYSGASTLTSSGGTVALTAIVTEFGDALPGDLRLATVQFINRANNAVLGSVAVGADGQATYNWAAAPGTYVIGFAVGNYYTRNNSADNVTVTVK